jgi:hypothetical protein
MAASADFGSPVRSAAPRTDAQRSPERATERCTRTETGTDRCNVLRGGRNGIAERSSTGLVTEESLPRWSRNG